jgi:hypothetical protein
MVHKIISTLQTGAFFMHQSFELGEVSRGEEEKVAT